MKRRNQPQGGPDPAHGHRASASAGQVTGWRPRGQPAILKPRQPTSANTNTTAAGIQLAKHVHTAAHPESRAGSARGSYRPGNCESRPPGAHSCGQGSVCIRAAANSGPTQIKAKPSYRILIIIPAPKGGVGARPFETRPHGEGRTIREPSPRPAGRMWPWP